MRLGGAWLAGSKFGALSGGMGWEGLAWAPGSQFVRLSWLGHEICTPSQSFFLLSLQHFRVGPHGSRLVPMDFRPVQESQTRADAAPPIDSTEFGHTAS